MSRYLISWPRTPGAQPQVYERATTLREARRLARVHTHHRKDLTGQDVRIERPDGALVEYAGPAR